jgi:hypothetical protein
VGRGCTGQLSDVASVIVVTFCAPAASAEGAPHTLTRGGRHPSYGKGWSSYVPL